MPGRWKYQLSTTSREPQRKEGGGAQREIGGPVTNLGKIRKQEGEEMDEEKITVGM